MPEHTRPSPETRAAERQEALADHDADGPPTSEEEELADELEADPEVAEHERDMTERGARQQGEGRLP
jgi:hypothetical protein